jgi:hypothetical protein
MLVKASPTFSSSMGVTSAEVLSFILFSISKKHHNDQFYSVGVSVSKSGLLICKLLIV